MSKPQTLEHRVITIEVNTNKITNPSKPQTLDDWVVTIDEKAKNVDLSVEESIWKKISIFHVPKCIKDKFPEEVFTPHVVSWGPFHNGAEHLQPLEEHKHRALTHFLKRSNKKLSHFVESLRSALKELQDCYEWLDSKWIEKPDDFLKMMLLDGCFMLEVLRAKQSSNKNDNNNVDMINYTDFYAPNDPVFSLAASPTRMPFLKRDMLLLENQLPLLVLKKLLEAEKCATMLDSDINKLVVQFLGENLKVEMETLASHPLELYRKCLLPPNNQPKQTRNINEEPNWIFGRKNGEQHGLCWSAVDLRNAGVWFGTSNNKNLIEAIQFDWNGKLTLPLLEVHDGTESNLLNMVALEQIHVGIGCEITSYVAFMDELIDTAEDVRLLQKKGIIKNSIGSNEAVAEMFNRLTKESTLDNKSSFGQVRYRVNKYCSHPWNRWRTNMIHTYFKSPWSFISLLGVILVILLTITQTIFGIFQVFPVVKSHP